MRRMRLSVVAVLASSLLIAGCGGGDSDKPGAEGSSSTSSAPAEPLTWPLTGLEVPADGSPESPAYIVKIDNSSDSAPQYGIGKADLVVEELVEGGITRLAVMFQSQLPGHVGPVRSMRLSDIGIAKPLGAEIVTSGAAQPTLDGLRRAGVRYVSFDSGNPAIRRILDGSHDSLHSVMADLKKLSKQGKQHSTPVEYLPFGDAALPAGTPAKTIDARMSAGRTAHWKFQGDKYVLQNGYMPDGDVFLPDTVIVCKVRTTTANYTDPAGNPVPISHFEGTGEAVIFHGGQAITATWVKPKVGDTVTFTTAAGELEIPAGHTWMHLVPQNGGGVSYR